MMQWTSVVVLVTLVSVTSALKCYHCNDCGNSRGTVIDCGEDADVCMKIDFAGRIAKICGQNRVCKLKEIEHGAVNAWNSVKNFFSNLDTGINVPDDTQAKVIECCDDDYCNSAVTKLMNPLLILLPLLMYFLQY